MNLWTCAYCKAGFWLRGSYEAHLRSHPRHAPAATRSDDEDALLVSSMFVQSVSNADSPASSASYSGGDGSFAGGGASGSWDSVSSSSADFSNVDSGSSSCDSGSSGGD